jgi:hypothetical protein
LETGVAPRAVVGYAASLAEGPEVRRSAVKERQHEDRQVDDVGRDARFHREQRCVVWWARVEVWASELSLWVL